MLMRFVVFFGVFICVNSIKVETKNGIYHGKQASSRLNNFKFYAFEGIRYAEPPVGELRFEPTQPYRKEWEEVVADNPGSHCMQMDRELRVSGDEDCLFLNIYTPNPNGSFPVIFYIHGGGFIFGRGNQYGAGHIIQRDLVVVTINYRLGPLGFLSGDSIQGNMGMKDQVEALKYVNKHINAFGGDPSRITITGWSAGGASVQLHYMSSMSKDLFTNGISHGGSALNPWVMQKNPDEKFKKMLAMTECSTVQCLKEIPAEKIVQKVANLQPYKGNPFNPFGLVVEKNASDAFLSEEPKELLRRGSFQKLPWIASGVSGEGYYPCAEYLQDSSLLPVLDKDFDILIPALLHFPSHSSPTLHAIIRKHYLGNESLTEETFNRFVKITTDYMYIVGIQESVQLQGPRMPVYSYGFDFKTQFAYGELMSHRGKLDHVAHGEDIILIYESSVRNGIPFSGDEIVVMNLLLDMYESFAYDGEPKMSNLPMVTGNGSDFLYLHGPDNVTTVLNYNFDVISEKPFWDALEELISTPSSAIHLLPSISLISIIGSLTLFLSHFLNKFE